MVQLDFIEENKQYLIIIIGVLLIFAINQKATQDKIVADEEAESLEWEDPIWLIEYRQDAQNAKVVSPFLYEHNDVINTDDDIKRIAKRIVENSDSVGEAAERALLETYHLIDYDASNSVLYACEYESSTEVLKKGYGMCVGMSKVAMSILREIGIASRPATGCLGDSYYGCVPDKIISYINKNEALKQAKLIPDSTLAIEEDGTVRYNGGAHLWVEIWLPDRGWIYGESTAGVLVEKDCQKYLPLDVLEEYNSEFEINICRTMVTPDTLDYWDQCEVW